MRLKVRQSIVRVAVMIRTRSWSISFVSSENDLDADIVSLSSLRLPLFAVNSIVAVKGDVITWDDE